MMLGIENAAAAALQPVPIRVAVPDPLTEFVKLADASPAMIWTADPDGFVTFANRSWLDFRARTLDQETGSGWAEGIHPEDARFCLRDYWSACNSGKPFRLEYRVLCGDHTYHHVERLGSPWFGPEGERRGYVGIISVTHRNDEADREARRMVEILSPRERQVLVLIGHGHSTKEIAGRLGVSYKTADSHRTHVLKKLGIHETASLVRLAIRAGVISA